MDPITTVLTDELLWDAFLKVVEQPSFGSKMAWWLTSPHAAERWLQFEFAFALDNSLRTRDGQKYAVACEVGRADLSVFEWPCKKYPLWENTPVSILELKWVGSWFVTEGYTLGGIDQDTLAIEQSNVPGTCLVVWTHVKTKPDAAAFEWISKGRNRFTHSDQIDSAMTGGRCRVAFARLGKRAVRLANETVEGLEFLMYAYRSSSRG